MIGIYKGGDVPVKATFLMRKPGGQFHGDIDLEFVPFHRNVFGPNRFLIPGPTLMFRRSEHISEADAAGAIDAITSLCSIGGKAACSMECASARINEAIKVLEDAAVLLSGGEKVSGECYRALISSALESIKRANDCIGTSIDSE